MQAWDGQRCRVAWKGQVLEVEHVAGSSHFSALHAGHPLPVSNAVAQAFPAFASLPSSAFTPQEGPGDLLPWTITGSELATCLAQLQREVQADPRPWCDGTQPGAPANSALRAATLTSGELLSLAAGARGIASVQLWNGWDAAQGQPVHDPLVLTTLTQVLAQPGIKSHLSTAPGGVGLTALLYADKEPWARWAPHLASFGFQANIVAGSPYFKLLTGRILGYKEENVRSYVVATSPPGALTVELLALVDSDIRKLSKAAPRLPWSSQPDSRGKKSKVGQQTSSRGFGKKMT
ncbi:hypothetical protein V8C86DRAFT_2521612 [Haematococcus lacustris]